MEYVDVVNENDEVMETVSKQEAHEKGLLHRTVIAEVIDKDGNWTLVEQSSDRQDAGQYVSPIGGHVTTGESEDEALKREAEEEYGLKGDYPFKLIGKKIFNREIRGRKENHLFVVYEIYSDENPILSEEAVSYMKYSRPELQRAMDKTPERFGAAFKFVMENFFPKNKL